MPVTLGTTLSEALLLIASAVVAGLMNSMAGGGTLFTFPALLAVGVLPLTANGTSTVALVPGSAAAAWGYRRELRGHGRTAALLCVPSVLGGVVGAYLTLRAGDALFAFLVPWLILTATVLFLLQERIAARIKLGPVVEPKAKPSSLRTGLVLLFMFAVSIYGGFFGAGMGILILAALGQIGYHDVHEMNGLKNIMAVCINGTSTFVFIAGGKVIWPLAGLMAAGAIVGGWAGAGLARRIGRQRVRQAVVFVGFAIAGIIFARRLW